MLRDTRDEKASLEQALEQLRFVSENFAKDLTPDQKRDLGVALAAWMALKGGRADAEKALDTLLEHSPRDEYVERVKKALRQ